MVLPAFLIFALGILYPFSYGVRTSLLNKNETSFVGVSNFQEVISDPNFWESMSFTIKYLVFVVLVELCTGTCLAFAVAGRVRKDLWRGLLIAPMLVVPVATGVMWKLMFHPTVGVVNYLLSLIGISRIEWLSKPTPAFFAVSIMDIWQWTPFIFLMVFAAIDVLPRDMYEAAAMDGANGIQMFRFITLPWIRNTLIFSFALRSLEVLKVFDHIFSSTNGGPGYATEHISLYLYRIGFKFLKFNYAAAGAIVIIVLVMILWTFVFMVFMRKENEMVLE